MLDLNGRRRRGLSESVAETKTMDGYPPRGAGQNYSRKLLVGYSRRRGRYAFETLSEPGVFWTCMDDDDDDMD